MDIMKKIVCTNKQYEVIRAIVRSLVRDLETRESYTKHLHRSRKNERFQVGVNWKSVRLLQHMKEQFK